IQNQRKDAGFDIADRIITYYAAGPKLAEVFDTHSDYIASETLSTSIQKIEPPTGAIPEEAYGASYKIEGEPLRIELVRT
ncbi:hypothetical protein GWN65_02595, partial [Candidatus Bathyarchaeota archaeon]|nr:hypothetical protein [Candidatus Bathyarchaeota archaeon]NIV43912.1 hypothetical protein [Candidatus Bathyarchaeota archaeon]